MAPRFNYLYKQRCDKRCEYANRQRSVIRTKVRIQPLPVGAFNSNICEKLKRPACPSDLIHGRLSRLIALLLLLLLFTYPPRRTAVTQNLRTLYTAENVRRPLSSAVKRFKLRALCLGGKASVNHRLTPRPVDRASLWATP